MRSNSEYAVMSLVAAFVLSIATPSLARKKKIIAQPVQPSLSHNDQKRYDYFYTQAARQEAAGKFDAAFDLFEHARSINPKASEVYYNEAMYFSQLKKDSLALEYFEKAAKLNPDNNTYLERVAQCYIAARNFPKATEAFELLSQKNSDNTEVLNVLVQLYNQQKDYPRMISTLNRIETVEGSSEQITLSKMHVYELMDDKKSAYNELKSLTTKHPNDMNYRVMIGNWLMQNNKQKDAYKLFQSALKEEPDNGYVLFSAYDYYNAVGQDSVAKSLMLKILTNDKTDSQTKAELLRQAIQKSESNGEDSTVILSLFDKAMAFPQKTSEIAELKAAYMSLKKMPSDSVNAAFKKVLDIAPDNAQARIQLIESLWAQHDYDGVIAMCKPAQEYNPDEMVFYYFMGLAYYQQQKNELALNSFRHAVAQVNSQSNPDMVSDFYVIMGDILSLKGQSEEAFAAYDSCLQWKADNYACLNNYAYYLSLKGENLSKAEQMSYKAIKAEPKNSVYLDTYAWILFMEGRYSEAKIYEDQAKDNLDEVSESGTIYDHLGDIYFKNNLLKEAVDFWKKACELDSTLRIAAWKLKNQKYISEEEFTKLTKVEANNAKSKGPVGNGGKKNTKKKWKRN